MWICVPVRCEGNSELAHNSLRLIRPQRAVAENLLHLFPSSRRREVVSRRKSENVFRIAGDFTGSERCSAYDDAVLFNVFPLSASEYHNRDVASGSCSC